jgi:cytochrome c oxidase subunit 4
MKESVEILSSETRSHGDDPGATAAGDHLRTLYIIFGGLMALMVLTIVASFIHFERIPWFNIVLAMAIAVTKATLVVLYFMHVLHGGRLVWVFAGSAFVWLVILLAMTLGDYMSRNRLPRTTADPFNVELRDASIRPAPGLSTPGR